MRAVPASSSVRMKSEDWPVARGDLERIVKDCPPALAKQIERVNETEFCLARTLILRDGFGERLSPRKSASFSIALLRCLNSPPLRWQAKAKGSH